MFIPKEQRLAGARHYGELTNFNLLRCSADRFASPLSASKIVLGRQYFKSVVMQAILVVDPVVLLW